MMYQHLLDTLNRLHYHLPQLMLKEIVMGRIMKSSLLFVPHYPARSEFKTDMEYSEALGYKKSSNTHVREEFSETSKRVEKCVRILFACESDDGYIGRLFQHIVLLLNFRFHQLSPQILFNSLEFNGKILLRTYRTAFATLLVGITERDGYCDKLEEYFKSGSVLREP